MGGVSQAESREHAALPAEKDAGEEASAETRGETGNKPYRHIPPEAEGLGLSPQEIDPELEWTAEDPWVLYVWRCFPPWTAHNQKWPCNILRNGLACAIIPTPEIDAGYLYMGEDFARYDKFGKDDYRWTTYRHINEGYASRWYPGREPIPFNLSQTGQPLSDEQKRRWVRYALDTTPSHYIDRVKREFYRIETLGELIEFYKTHPHGTYNQMFSFRCNPATGIEIDLRVVDGGNVGTVPWKEAWAIWKGEPTQSSLF